MALDTNKVSEVYSGQDISSLSDRPNEDGMTAAQLKARFDNLIKNLIPKHNSLIDALVLLLETGSETNGHTHNMDNIVDGVTNRLFTELLKLKLDSIQANAEVNQNAFSSIKVGTTTGNADSKTATFEIAAGLNIVASIDPLTNKVTLSATGTLATQAVQSLIDDIGNYFTSLEVNGALQEIGASLYPSLSKTTPVDADTILLSDSASSGVFKKTTWANIKATLKTYFDTIYQAILVSGTNIKTVNGETLLGSGNLSTDWNLIHATLTYASADSPTFVANTSIDFTSVISVGMKLRLTQTTVKYFIVTAITSTTITLYGGTDYVLANVGIVDVRYSSMKAPFGFPLDVDKWTVQVLVGTHISQSNPGEFSWYNIGSTAISVPIGKWLIEYSVIAQSGIGISQDRYLNVTLSTTNNSQSNKSYSVAFAQPSCTFARFPFNKSFNYSNSSKITLYLNTMSDLNAESLSNLGGSSPTIIKAVCAYL